MLTYKEMDNLAAVEIELSDRVSIEEFDKTAKKFEASVTAGCACSKSSITLKAWT